MGNCGLITGAFSSDTTISTPVAINKGGTGQTTAQAALDALAAASGSLVQGDILIVDSSTNLVRLARGTDNYVLTMNGSNPNWEASSGGDGDMVLDEVQTVTASKSYSADLIITDAATVRVGGTTPTISSGALTMVANTARADTEGSASTDDLDSIAINLGAFVNLHASNDARTIVVKDGTLITAGDFSLDNSADTWFALRNPQHGFVVEISRSDNAA